jgi:hypothetical protein
MDKLNKDELFLLALKLELPDLLNFCILDKRINDKIYKRDDIWNYKLNKHFPDSNLHLLNLVLTPREKYKLLYVLTKVKEKLNREETIHELYNLKKKLNLFFSLELKEIPAYLGNL